MCLYVKWLQNVWRSCIYCVLLHHLPVTLHANTRSHKACWIYHYEANVMLNPLQMCVCALCICNSNCMQFPLCTALCSHSHFKYSICLLHFSVEINGCSASCNFFGFHQQCIYANILCICYDTRIYWTNRNCIRINQHTYNNVTYEKFSWMLCFIDLSLLLSLNTQLCGNYASAI